MSETIGSKDGAPDTATTEAESAEVRAPGTGDTEAKAGATGAKVGTGAPAGTEPKAGTPSGAAAGAQAAEAAAGAAKKKRLRADSTGKLLRVAVALIFVGLVLELVPLLYFRPITFVIFFFFGIPIAALGMLIYVWRVLRSLRETGAL